MPSHHHTSHRRRHRHHSPSPSPSHSLSPSPHSHRHKRSRHAAPSHSHSLSRHVSHSKSRSRHRRHASRSRNSRHASRSGSRSDSEGRSKRRRRVKSRRRSYSTVSGSSGSSSISTDTESKSSKSVVSVSSEKGLTEEQIVQKRELESLTRDARTVFVSQLQVKATEDDIRFFFDHGDSFLNLEEGRDKVKVKKAKVKRVKEVVLIKDRFSNKSKGYGYVELRSLEDVPKALEMTGKRFVFQNGKVGFPILVKASEAEKNFTHLMEKRANTATATYSRSSVGFNDIGGVVAAAKSKEKIRESNPILKEMWPDKLEISSLHPSIEVQHVRELCEPFGPVLDIDLVTNSSETDGSTANGEAKSKSGKSVKCFVMFEHKDDARKAMKELDGLKLVDRRLKVKRMLKGQVSKLKGTSQVEINKMCGIEELTAEDNIANIERLNQATGGAFSTNTWRLEADDSNIGQYGGGGVAMNAAQKLQLMSKLAGGAGSELLARQQQNALEYLQSQHQTQLQEMADRRDPSLVDDPNMPGKISGIASEFLLVKNLFTKDEILRDENLRSVIKDDVLEEVEKIGKVRHIYVEKARDIDDSMDACGRVFLRMENAEKGVDTASTLHGRWFAKRLVKVEYLTREDYEELFPELKK